MKKTTFGLSYVLFLAITGLVICPGNAAVRVGNLSRSYADAYQQVNTQRAMAQAATQQYSDVTTNSADAATNLPVRVANTNMESCAMIYPDGEFAWDRPSLGMGAGGAHTCVAVIELRGVQMGENGSDAVLARANLAAGDSFKCNISEFPEATYTQSVNNVTFPSDTEPTIDDVVQIMNQEQKQNAALKIAAATLVGGISGNMAGKNELGSDSLLGGGKAKTKSTIIGALSGAALMTGSTFAGKKAGDIILSTGVNAAAGGVIGNMMSTGNSVLRIENCTIDGQETTCLWGAIIEDKDFDGVAFINKTDNSTIYVCKKETENDATKYTNCKTDRLINVKLTASDGTDVDLEDAIKNKYTNVKYEIFGLKKDDKTSDFYMQLNGDTTLGEFIKIKSAKIPVKSTPALIANVENTAFGLKLEDWRNKIKKNTDISKLYGRATNGDAYKFQDYNELTLDDFHPSTQSAEDGGLIDLGNKARTKSTLVGAGAGGALGAFVGYQSAESDINERWVTAVREYKDSLMKVYCITGKRFLGYYNDMLTIPSMTE